MMNPGQEKFYLFILERVQEDKQEEAKALLSESFAKQAAGTFDAQYAAAFAPTMAALLKPEHVEEVRAIMSQYSPRNG